MAIRAQTPKPSSFSSGGDVSLCTWSPTGLTGITYSSLTSSP